MSAQILALRPLPVPEPTGQMTYEEYSDFLNTLAVFMAAGHRLGDVLRKKKKTIPAIRIYGAVRIMSDAHEILTREAHALKK